MRIRWIGYLSILMVSLVLIGCGGSRGPMPYDVHGRYFMAGDPNCVRFQPTRNPRVIQCMDTQGHLTHKRRAMTDQELLMYTHRQQMRQMRDIEAQLMFNRMDRYGPWWW